MPSFYRAFEDRYRGSRELIKERLKVYHSFIAPLRTLYSECQALDLGCGRGEWLELLQECGFQAQGVDLDEGMLEVCEELQLPVEQCDALLKLKALPAESLTVVSGFHIAEHIPFASLQTLVDEALRVLKPAGLLILETPNAENLVVGTNNFYLDPTHERPLPHLLLGFLTEYAGFSRSKLLRLQEAPALREATDVDLMQVLGGVSPDYGIVAQKQGTAEQTQLFDNAFLTNYGVALGALAERYERGLKNRFTALEGRLETTVKICETLSEYIAHLQGRSATLMEKSNHASSHPDATGAGRARAMQTAANPMKLDVDVLQGEALAHHLRLQLQETLHRLSNAESRYQTSELALRDQLARAAQAEGKLANAQASVEVYQSQLQQVTAELLTVYKEQQRLAQIFDDERLQHVQKYAQSVSKLDEEKARSEVLCQQLAEQKVQAQSLNEEREVLIADRQALAGERDDARAEIVAAKTASLQLHSDIQQLRSDIQQRVARAAELEGSVVQAELRSQLAASQLQEVLKHSTHLQEQLRQSQHTLEQVLADADQLALQASAHEARVSALLGSMSWRISAPLRGMAIAIRWLLAAPVRLLKAAMRPLMVGMMKGVLSRPGLSERINHRLKRFPRVHAHLRAFALKRGFLSDAVVQEPVAVAVASRQVSAEVLTPIVQVVEVATARCEPVRREALSLDFNDASTERLFEVLIQKTGGTAHAAIGQAHKKIIDDCSEK
ncbi:methyltransferase domain-containing protein [Pseudomonas donghuensis]|uniref:class I SAM-dependent methyltransferase n=1 Tax=Pseudomonas donghuensis TaxID=1163398 RepID=UPI001CB91866|nr:class I SAM-dependent methyltransferase [Pseudomonas donghuensis]WKY27017.1 methyltransferase domain-containing protein [Pseudomonas donghuensis]